MGRGGVDRDYLKHCVVRYVQYTRDVEMVIRMSSIPESVDPFVDANFANDEESRKSTSSGSAWLGGSV